jgi:D-inositol-3-phosphate glycosyltransferase
LQASDLKHLVNKVNGTYSFPSADVDQEEHPPVANNVYGSKQLSHPMPQVAILTGGADKPYALGLASALNQKGIPIDFIGSDEINSPELHNNPLVRFLNLRGDQSPQSSLGRKLRRVLIYYARLVAYAATSAPTTFHILWNNKFEMFDRTLLMLYYRLLGKKIVLTAHNINTAKRDKRDSWFNRLTLGFQYRLCDNIFVHSERMRAELMRDFGTPPHKGTVIPFGINNSIPVRGISRVDARRSLGLAPNHRAILFFGNIVRYKGLEIMIQALALLLRENRDYRLIIAGRPKARDSYWDEVKKLICKENLESAIIERSEYIPDELVEMFFAAADVLVLPYLDIFQSGVLFLGYNFGLPVVASDVGSMGDDIVIGETGFLTSPGNKEALTEALKTFFASELFRNSELNRSRIRAYAHERYSWARVAEITESVYASLRR